MPVIIVVTCPLADQTKHSTHDRRLVTRPGDLTAPPRLGHGGWPEADDPASETLGKLPVCGG